jgi:hypothetical protein
MNDDAGSMDEQDELLHATTTHTRTTAILECSPWWISSSDNPKICPNWVTLTLSTLSVTTELNINPIFIYTNPRWDPLGGCAPPLLKCCSLVIPPSESGCNCLNMSAMASSKLGRKGFPGSGSVISLEP